MVWRHAHSSAKFITLHHMLTVVMQKRLHVSSMASLLGLAKQSLQFGLLVGFCVCFGGFCVCCFCCCVCMGVFWGLVWSCCCCLFWGCGFSLMFVCGVFSPLRINFCEIFACGCLRCWWIKAWILLVGNSKFRSWWVYQDKSLQWFYMWARLFISQNVCSS